MALDFNMRTSQGRCPPFIVAGLLLICAILGFNYWSMTSQSYELLKQIEELQDQVKLSNVKRENSEKINTALKQRLHQYEEDIARVKISSDKKGQELQEVKQKFQEKDYEITSVKGEIHTLKEEVESLKSNLQKKLKEIQAKDSELKKSADSKVTLTKEVNDLKSAATAKDAEAKSLKQNITQLEEQVRILKNTAKQPAPLPVATVKTGKTPVKPSAVPTVKPTTKIAATVKTTVKGKVKRAVDAHVNLPAAEQRPGLEAPLAATGNLDAAEDDKNEHIRNSYDENDREQDDEGNDIHENIAQNTHITVNNDNLEKMARNLQDDEEGLTVNKGSETVNVVDMPNIMEVPQEPRQV